VVGSQLDPSACARKAHIGTPGWCAQTRSEDHQSAANANQVPKKNGPEIVNFQARFITLGSLSKPPPSASRPPHRRL